MYRIRLKINIYAKYLAACLRPTPLRLMIVCLLFSACMRQSSELALATREPVPTAMIGKRYPCLTGIFRSSGNMDSSGVICTDFRRSDAASSTETSSCSLTSTNLSRSTELPAPPTLPDCCTSVFRAVQESHMSCLVRYPTSLLMEVDVDGKTVLHVAARYGDMRIIGYASAMSIMYYSYGCAGISWTRHLHCSTSSRVCVKPHCISR